MQAMDVVWNIVDGKDDPLSIPTGTPSGRSGLVPASRPERKRVNKPAHASLTHLASIRYNSGSSDRRVDARAMSHSHPSGTGSRVELNPDHA